MLVVLALSTEIYTARVSRAADDTHRPQLHGFAGPGTDGRTDGYGTVLIRFPHTRSANKSVNTICKKNAH